MQPEKKLLALLFASTAALPAFSQMIGGIDTHSQKPLVQKTADFSCVLDTLFTTIDPWPAGLAKQGNDFWVSGYTYDTLYKTGYNGNRLSAVGIDLGKNSIGGDLYYDGSALWAVAEQKAILYKFNPDNGALLDTIFLPAHGKGDPNSYGITGDGTHLWHSEYIFSGDTSRIYTLNPADGTVESYFDIPAIILGMKYLGNGELLGVSPFPVSVLHKINVNTGTLVDSVVLCFPYPTSVEVSHDSIFVVSSQVGSNGDRKVYLIEASSILTTALREPVQPVAITVFPNPARDEVTVIIDDKHQSRGEWTISILDLMGKLVKTVQATFLHTENQTTIPISDLAPGLYGIQIKAAGVFMTKKLIIL